MTACEFPQLARARTSDCCSLVGTNFGRPPFRLCGRIGSSPALETTGHPGAFLHLTYITYAIILDDAMTISYDKLRSSEKDGEWRRAAGGPRVNIRKRNGFLPHG